MSKLFISHSSQDDAFVRELRWTLADLKQEVWIDSRELRAGDPLWPEIQKAIDESSAVAVAGAPAQAASLLQQLAANPDAVWLLPFIRALQTIVAGSRDRTLADTPDLNFMMAAEVLFLIETLEKSR